MAGYPDYMIVRFSSVIFGLKNLSQAYSYVLDSSSFYKKIQRVTGDSNDKISHYDDEARSFIKSLGVKIGAGPELKCRALYIIIRSMRPKNLVETGVATGFTSACILAALDKNEEKNYLYSIDLPIHVPKIDSDGQLDASVIPQDQLPGYIIPNNLRERWSLYLGRSDEKLLGLLKEIGNIDVFLHDSEHSYSNMMFEFSASFPYLSNGGLLASDDISYNESFQEFCHKNELQYATICYLGLARKNT